MINYTRRNFVFATFVVLTLAAAGVNAQTLGNYPNTAIYAGGNTTLESSVSPSATAEITAYTSPNFKGVLSVSRITGQVRVTNAQPAGTYTVTVKAFGANPVTRTFTLRVLRLGCGNFSASANYAPAPNSSFQTPTAPQAITIADFNNDNRQDAIVGGFSAGSPSVSRLSGEGDGGFTGNLIPNSGTHSQFSGAADFTGDGLMDAVVGNVMTNTVSIFLNGGNGLQFASTVGSGLNPRGIAVGDWNGDGRADFAAANSGDATVTVWLGNGNGTFTVAAGSPITVVGEIFGMTRGDFNNDGNYDLAIADGAESRSVQILLGGGNGTFSQAVGSPFEIFAVPRNVAVADFNNDGNQDLITDSSGNGYVSLLIGNGNGGFTVSDVEIGNLTIGVAAADVNGDGNQDFLVSDSELNGSQTKLYLGNGAGGFTASGALGGLSNPSYIAVGDFDSNDFLDLAIIEKGTNRMASRRGSCGNRITTGGPSLPNAQPGAVYNQTITVSNAGTYTFSATGLPPNLTINSNGLISGTPTTSGTFIITVTATQTAFAPGDETSKQFQLLITAPTAATVTVAGRVLNGQRGISRARVTLTDASGSTRSALTNSFGYYSFDEVGAGETYIFSVHSKRYSFATQVVTVTKDLTELNFTAQSNFVQNLSK